MAGANSIALIYNIAMFKAAHLTPPKTWADLVSDAKALTTPAHYGIALTCEPAEDTTWQWEPFFWTNGGAATFSNVSGAPGVQALTLWSQLVSDGSASKSCLTWSQTPAASTQFIDGKAAMMVNGPWNFPTMNQANQFYGKQFDDDQNVRAVLGPALAEAGNSTTFGPGLPGYTMVDLTASRAVTRNVEVYFGVQNLFNQEYFVATLPDTIGTPRLINGGVRLHFAGK